VDVIEKLPEAGERQNPFASSSKICAFNPVEPFAGPGFFLMCRYSQVQPFSRHKEHDGLSKLPASYQ
jgi:hypothetical protein